jgi:hypothetical protein
MRLGLVFGVWGLDRMGDVGERGECGCVGVIVTEACDEGEDV